MSQEFIIVIKAPKNKLQARIVSFIDIVLTDETLPVQPEKLLSHKDKKVVLKEKEQKIEILLLGFLDNPPIRCVRQLFN